MHPSAALRSFASRTVRLAYTKYPAKESTARNAPLVVCHGLFGSKQNWRSLAKSMSVRLSRDVYTLDMRNHGDSPHVETHTYQALADDLDVFIREHGLQKPILLGHSMGGKAVMTAALNYPDTISKLIVVDIAPFAMPLSNDFAAYVDAMRQIDQASVTKQSQADAMLASVEPELGVRQFLLTNLKKQPDTGIYRFRIPYEILGRALGNMGDFMQLNGEKVYTGPTLFIAGGKSGYSKPFKERPDQVKAMFPNSKIDVIEGAGHWVHAEKPEPFMNSLERFVGKTDH